MTTLSHMSTIVSILLGSPVLGVLIAWALVFGGLHRYAARQFRSPVDRRALRRF